MLAEHFYTYLNRVSQFSIILCFKLYNITFSSVWLLEGNLAKFQEIISGELKADLVHRQDKFALGL